MHVTDDVLLLAQAAIGKIDPQPASAAASKVRGHYLCGCCRYFEFRIVASDVTQSRARLEAHMLHQGRLRDFFGFNRGKHAVVEAAILATRTHVLPLEQIAAEYDRLEVLVHKTGGPAELQAFRLLRGHLAKAIEEGANAVPIEPEGANWTAGRER